MEIVVTVIMVLVISNVVLKSTFHRLFGKMLFGLVAALFVGLSHEYVIMLSKTQLAGWIADPDLMLDVAVIMTVDVGFQIYSCVRMLDGCGGRPVGKYRWIYLICLWFPGVLVFPVLFLTLVQIVFALPGYDFAIIGWGTAGGVLIVLPLLGIGLERLLPEKDIRIELEYMINVLIAILGIIVTVDGRTSVAAADRVEWDAMIGVCMIGVAGTLIGLVLYKYISRKQITKLQ
ncbi:MAG: hypothetical protein ACI3Z7_03715 [Candidatus Aphodosoma sp.]